MTTTTDIARRIRALLDKAEASEFVHERDAFTSKAMQLMTEHRITEAMLAAAAGPADRRGRIGEGEIELGSGPYVRARLALLCAVAEGIGCSVVTHVSWEGRIATVHGFDSDRERVEVLYTSLLVQAVAGAHRVSTPRGSSTVSVRRSFLFGFAQTIGERLDAITEVAVQIADHDAETHAARSVALVLADRRDQVEDYVRRRYGRLGTMRAATVRATGFDEGIEAGRRADLGDRRGIGAGSRAAIAR